MLFLAVDIFAVANLHDKDDEFPISNCIDYPVIAFTDTIQILFPDEFLDALRTRIVLQGFHAPDEAFLDRRGEGSELAFGRWGEEDRIGHRWLEAEILQNRIE